MDTEDVYYAMAYAYENTATRVKAIEMVSGEKNFEDYTVRFLKHLWMAIDAYRDINPSQ